MHSRKINATESTLGLGHLSKSIHRLYHFMCESFTHTIHQEQQQQKGEKTNVNRSSSILFSFFQLLFRHTHTAAISCNSLKAEANGRSVLIWPIQPPGCAAFTLSPICQEKSNKKQTTVTCKIKSGWLVGGSVRGRGERLTGVDIRTWIFNRNSYKIFKVHVISYLKCH